MFLNTRWNFEPKNPAECGHGSDIDDAFPAAKCCASVDPPDAAPLSCCGDIRDSAYLLYVLLLFAPGPLVTLLEGQFSLVGRQAYSAKAGAEYLNRRREDVSDLFLLTWSKTGPILASLNERRSVGSTTPRVRITLAPVFFAESPSSMSRWLILHNVSAPESRIASSKF